MSLAVGLAAGAVGGAVAANKVKNKEPEKSQLEIREIQTRQYDNRDTKVVMKTMLNVLQDDGFIVTEANSFGTIRFGDGFAIGDLLRPLLSGGQANHNAYGHNSGMLCHCPNGAMHGQCAHFHCHQVGSHTTERASGKEALLNALPNVWYDFWFSR